MRPKERIPIFIKYINIRKLIVGWFANEKIPCFSMNKAIKEITTKILYLKQYWDDNPDLRFSQVLVSTGVLPNIAGTWYYDEELAILLNQGCKIREVMLWGRNKDEKGDRLLKTEWILLQDMSDDHIKAILDDVKTKKYKLGDQYLTMFRDELVYRAKKLVEMEKKLDNAKEEAFRYYTENGKGR